MKNSNENIFVYVREDIVANCGILKLAQSLYSNVKE